MKRQEGKIIGWVIVDTDTGEWLVRCETRKRARWLAAGLPVRICKIVESH